MEGILAQYERNPKDQFCGSVISVGDVVLLKDDNKRKFWRFTIVGELLAGTDGQIHAAIIRVGEAVTDISSKY